MAKRKQPFITERACDLGRGHDRRGPKMRPTFFGRARGRAWRLSSDAIALLTTFFPGAGGGAAAPPATHAFSSFEGIARETRAVGCTMVSACFTGLVHAPIHAPLDGQRLKIV